MLHMAVAGTFYVSLRVFVMLLLQSQSGGIVETSGFLSGTLELSPGWRSPQKWDREGGRLESGCSTGEPCV